MGSGSSGLKGGGADTAYQGSSGYARAQGTGKTVDMMTAEIANLSQAQQAVFQNDIAKIRKRNAVLSNAQSKGAIIINY